MKNILLLISLMLLLAGCSGSSSNYKNPYLPDYGFSMQLNLDLPLYSNLKVAVNPKIVTDPQSGVTLIIMKVSDTDFRAWDVNCPNHYISACSTMAINGLNAKCSCEDYEYSLFTGSGEQGEYPMKPYRVEIISQNLIRVYN